MGGATLLLGVTGYTGALILADLLIDFPQASIRVAGRDPERVREAVAAVPGGERVVVVDQPVDSTDKEALAAALDGVEQVISAVGPYNLYGQALLELAAARGLVYLDITGEQAFVRGSFERVDPKARASGATIVHSCSFESALADLMAHRLLASDPTGWEEISSYYQFTSSRPSPGTRLTMKLARNFEQLVVRDGGYVAANPMDYAHSVAFEQAPNHKTAAFTPYPEVIFFQRRYRPSRATSYLLLTDAEADLALGRTAAAAKSADFYVKQHERRKRPGPTVEEREGQAFGLGVVATRGDEVRLAWLTGSDMYRLTSVLVTEGLARLTSSRESGVLSPAEALEGPGRPFFLDRIVDRHGLSLNTA